MYTKETTLDFSLPFKRITEAENIAKMLKDHNIEFVFYKSEGYWNHVFCVRVRKSGYTYNAMMKLINAIYAPKYKKVNHTINDEGKVVVEV